MKVWKTALVAVVFGGIIGYLAGCLMGKAWVLPTSFLSTVSLVFAISRNPQLVIRQ